MKAARAAARAVEVIQYLSMYPTRTFTLTELARATSVNSASLLDVLVALTEAGWVVRHPAHKTYRLGPVLVPIGRAAAAGNPVVDLVRPVMRELMSLGTECVGSAAVGDDILVLALEGRPAGNGRDLRVGYRIPLVPPFGLVFLAWDSAEWVTRWAGRVGIDSRAFQRSLAAVRARGFAVGLNNPGVTRMHDLADAVAARPYDEVRRAELAESILSQVDVYVLDEIDPDLQYDVAMVSAPIFRPDRTVEFALTVQGIGSCDGARLREVGERLAGECAALTRELGGYAL